MFKFKIGDLVYIKEHVYSELVGKKLIVKNVQLVGSPGNIFITFQGSANNWYNAAHFILAKEVKFKRNLPTWF